MIRKTTFTTLDKKLNNGRLTLSSIGETLYRLIPFVYLAYAVVMVCITTFIMPPFQNPDEPNHFARAEQVSMFEWVPVFIHENSKIKHRTRNTLFASDEGGFVTDKGIYAVNDTVEFGLKSNSKLVLEKANKIKWGTGTIHFNFGNTAIYPPVVYIMPALGIGIGKLFDLSVSHTLYLARIFNGMLSIAIATIALLMAKRSRLLLFIVLLFPMTVALFASVSQDAILISCSFLLVAIIDSVEFAENGIYKNWQFYTMVLLLSVIAVGKPPYLLFILIIPFTKLNFKQKAIGAGFPIIALAAWLIINHSNFGVHFAPVEMQVNSRLQLQGLIHSPLNFMRMFFDYDKPALINIGRSFAGVLGPLKIVLSDIYYRNAYIILLIGAILTVGLSRNNKLVLRFVLIATALLTILAIITAQYITWTTVGSKTLCGMQGRYLLPVYPFLALALAGNNPIGKIAWLKVPLLVALMAFPVYTTVIMVKGLTSGYYSGIIQAGENRSVTTSQKNQHLCTL